MEGKEYFYVKAKPPHKFVGVVLDMRPKRSEFGAWPVIVKILQSNERKLLHGELRIMDSRELVKIEKPSWASSMIINKSLSDVENYTLLMRSVRYREEHYGEGFDELYKKIGYEGRSNG